MDSRGARSALPAALVGAALLLAACGSQRAGTRDDGLARARVPSPGLSAGALCGAPPSGTPDAPTAPALPPSPFGLEKDGVRITGMSPDRACVEFQVVNHASAPFTYTITFGFLSASGEALANAPQTVAAVKPGQTVTRTVTASEAGGAEGPEASVRILTVRSVPTAEVATESGPCPPSGTRVYADDGDAAMGLRVVGIHLQNCGRHTLRLDGFPRLQILDEDHRSPRGVRILHGGSAIATGTGADGPARPVVLKPGEQARAELVWRDTVEAGVGDPVNAPYVRMWSKPGAAPRMMIPELDLGTTGKLAVGPWKRDDTRAR